MLLTTAGPAPSRPIFPANRCRERPLPPTLTCVLRPECSAHHPLPTTLTSASLRSTDATSSCVEAAGPWQHAWGPRPPRHSSSGNWPGFRSGQPIQCDALAERQSSQKMREAGRQHSRNPMDMQASPKPLRLQHRKHPRRDCGGRGPAVDQRPPLLLILMLPAVQQEGSLLHRSI